MSTYVHLCTYIGALMEGQHLLEAVMYVEGGGGEGVVAGRVWFEIGLENHPLKSITQSRASGGQLLPNISFGVLVSAGSITLARTLSALRATGMCV